MELQAFIFAQTNDLYSQVKASFKIYQMGLDVRKSVFGGLRTTKAQTSLCIRAV